MTEVEGSTSTNDVGLSEDELIDISNSPAISLLKELVESGELPEREGAELREQYETLHKSILEMYEDEKRSLKQAKQLNQDLLAEKIKLEKLTIRKHEESQALTALEKEHENSNKELEELEEKSSQLHLQVTELERDQGEAQRNLEQTKKENAELVEPEFEEARQNIRELEEEVSKQGKALELCKKDHIGLTKRQEELEKTTEALMEEKLQQKQYLNKIKADPERIRKQADVVETAAGNLGLEVNSLLSQIAEADRKLEEQAKKKQEVNEVARDLTRKLDLHRSTIEQRERDVDTVRTSLEQEKSKHQDLLAKRVHVELLLKEEKQTVKQTNQDFNIIKKEFEAQKKLLKKRVAQLDNVKATLPQLESNCSDAISTRHSYQMENKNLTKTLTVLKQEVDIFIANYLRQEHIEKDKKETLQRQGEEIKECEKQIGLWIEEEHKQAKQMSMLNAQREIKAREASKANAMHRAAVQDLKIKELTMLDLTKKLGETNGKLREFSALYDVVKNERNKYVNLIQASSQALAEMKEKIKILENEVEILRNESLAKDKSLTKERLAHQTAQCQRDGARHEMNKCQAVYKEKQNHVEQQIVEIDKLNSIINGMEKSMMRLKKQYELAVEHRNFTGVQLIDRNDELCILYEKANIQEETLKRGEIGLRQKEEQVRMVKLEIAELERSLMNARKKIPQVPQIGEKILRLKKNLTQERGLTEKLCEDLETPENEERWRALLGEDPDLEQLQAQLQILEERLNSKKEQLLEKELVLEEVSELSAKLKVKANEGRKNTLALAKDVNSFQSRIKETTRKMMALVSELSMYQATAMKLEQEKHDREKELEDAEWRLKNNQAPTEEAEYEWYRLEREEINKLENSRRPNILVDGDSSDPMAANKRKGPARTTAQARPNAYIPANSLGIPKPYGSQAPFKPTPAGSTMRHIKQPKPREIEI